MSSTGGALGISSTSPHLANLTVESVYEDTRMNDGEKSETHRLRSSPSGSQQPSLHSHVNDQSSPSSGKRSELEGHAVVAELEKGEVLSYTQSRNDDGHLLLSTDDPFPEDPDAEEEQQFTIRAVLVGSLLGGIIAASNLYLGLKTGWTFGASLFGSIFGYAILKPMSKILPERFGGGYFGPKENVCCQSAATAAGSLGLLFTSGFPAIYQIGLLGKSPGADFGKLVTFTFTCAYFGMFFAVPLRKFYILKQKLVFPAAVAAAHTIRSLHVGKNAEANARKKTRALIIAFCSAITLRVVSEYAPGILWDWHLSWALYRLGWHWIIRAESWNWVWEWTPAFIGVGMLVGRASSYSFLSGTFLAWACIGPAIVATGLAFTEAISPEYPGYFTVNNMVMADPVHHPSPRYWLVWPGTMLLLAGSFAELGANYKTLGASFLELLRPLISKFRKVDVDEDALIHDPAPLNEQVPLWMWGGGVIVSAFMSCVVLGFYYKQNVGVTILGILFAFIFSFIGAESTGRTAITPVTSIGNASQLVIGGVTRNHYSVPSAQLQNCMGGMLALGASLQSADMLGDLKTTHLLRASPRVQFYAQMIGSLVAIFMSVGMYVLFSAAYPCINDLSLAASCSFPAPDVSAWRAIAVAVTDPSLPIPPSSGYTAIGFAVGAILMTIIKYKFIPVNKQWMVPNAVAVGIAFILPATTYPLAMAFGATVAWLWQKRNPGSYAMYCYAIAAGFIAGEGLGGIVGAVLQIAHVSGSYYGTTVGCPAFVYCG